MVAAAVLAATVGIVVGGTARAQPVGAIAVLPDMADPGGVVTVSSGPSSPCEPPRDTPSPFASVDLFASGTATPVNRAPYQGVVATSGTWSVQVRLAPDLPPGTYRVQAGCYTDSGLNSGFGPAYSPGRLDVRLQNPGQPSLNARRARPGETVQVTAGGAACPPPAGSPSPRVRVSILDGVGATRAEAEAPVAGNGQWAVGVRVPDILAQTGTVTAVCLARVGASSPYARYQAALFTIDANPQSTSTTTPLPQTTTTTVPPGPGAPVTPPTTATMNVNVAELPPTPIAAAVVAEPTYTG
jgi:hypothetical protein